MATNTPHVDYACYGSKDDGCGKRHYTLKTAILCILHFEKARGGHYGPSDRRPVRLDGGPLTGFEEAEIARRIEGRKVIGLVRSGERKGAKVVMVRVVGEGARTIKVRVMPERGSWGDREKKIMWKRYEPIYLVIPWGEFERIY